MTTVEVSSARLKDSATPQVLIAFATVHTRALWLSLFLSIQDALAELSIQQCACTEESAQKACPAFFTCRHRLSLTAALHVPVRRACLPTSRRTSRCRTKCMRRRAISHRMLDAEASLTPAVQELDKQSVDTNALLKLANTHVRLENVARVMWRWVV